jgi:peptidyl-tRNA hydrolase
MTYFSSKSTLTNVVQEYADFPESLFMAKPVSKKAYMYLLVNSSLKLTPGKVASQVGHAVEKITQKCSKVHNYKAYLNNGMPKIVLSVPTEENFISILDQTKQLFKVYVVDEGLTQCPQNSVTVVGYSPIYESNIPPVFKKLSLYNK